MKTLNVFDDFEVIKNWLDLNLDVNKSIIPCKEELINLKLKDVSKSKGIYFWFMLPEGYLALSSFIPIQTIESKFSKIIDNLMYDLVYLGTTGTGKQGKNNFYGRLEWHINQIHRESSIKQNNSALSTLRTGLGSLLANDLIFDDTETIINDFMKTNMRVFWVQYPNEKSLIDKDEKILIKGLKPLFNLKNNPNSLEKAADNPTKKYKARRNLIESKTKTRLGLKTQVNINENKNIQRPDNPQDAKVKNKKPKNDMGELIHEKGYIEFKVKIYERISDISNNQTFPVGKLTINIKDTKTNKVVYQRERTIRTKGRTLNEYFSSIDSSGLPKWQVIQNEMKQNNIEEITVKVCPIN